MINAQFYGCKTMNKIPIILDTDIGDDIDDLFALLVCILHPKIDLKAVTLVNCDVLNKARLVSKVFRLLGVKNIPIGVGKKVSRARLELGELFSPFESWNRYVRFVDQNDPAKNMSFPSAFDVMEKVLSESSEKVNIVCIGPLTNIADLIDRSSHIEKINCFSVMAGEIYDQMKEYNIWCDPEAAQVVFNYGLPVFLGTFGETKKISFPLSDCEKYLCDKNNIIHNIINDCLKLWVPNLDPVLYDLAPVYYLTNPEWFEVKDTGIDVELSGKYTRAYTIENSNRKNVKVSLKIDTEKIINTTVSLFNGVKQCV